MIRAKHLRPNAVAGFTLLEVMIALTILALVGVAFLRTQASSVRLVDESSQISLATLLAREKMTELESTGFPELGKDSGTGGEAFPQFRWEKTVSSSEIFGLRQAQVKIYWMEGNRERSLDFTAYFARH